jgi:chromosomal replication initiation ATPase DnaA
MNIVHAIETPVRTAVLHINGGRPVHSVRLIIDLLVALVFAIDLADLQATRRGSPKVAFARQVSMYLAHVACSLSLTEVGVLFGRERSTVAHACCLIEDRRDDPELDLKLDHLERAIVALMKALAWAGVSQ